MFNINRLRNYFPIKNLLVFLLIQYFQLSKYGKSHESGIVRLGYIQSVFNEADYMPYEKRKTRGLKREISRFKPPALS